MNGPVVKVHNRTGALSMAQVGGSSVWPVLVLALGMRLLFFQPFYLPPDALDYLNSWDAFFNGQQYGFIRYVRLGMALPLAFASWLAESNLFFGYSYIFACSLGIVWLTYRLGYRWGGPYAGVLAGGILAIVPMEVVYGAVLLPDVPLSFLALVAFYFASDSPGDERARLQRFFAVGLFIGLAYTCKVTALFFLPPAIAHVYFHQRKLRHIFALGAGVTLVICGEILLLGWLVDGWHVRILDTVGYALGTKGNYVRVDKTWVWWLGQIRFKFGALFWGEHLPTNALLVAMPHLVVLALWRSRRMKLPAASWWLAAWGGAFVAQQLLLSTIEQEPRLLQPALPYLAVIIGVVFAPNWGNWKAPTRWGIGGGALFMSLCGALSFWGTHAPSASVNRAIYEQLQSLQTHSDRVLLDSPSAYMQNLAHYAGLQTALWQPNSTAPTHWISLYNGYAKKGAAEVLPEGMQQHYEKGVASPIRPLFKHLGFLPGVGDSSRVVLYQRAHVGRDGERQ
jgi:hypothetical protein